jgi:ATP-dependent Clp protease ATP-binding subunit ClpA
VHLLYALLDSKGLIEILSNLKINTTKLKKQLDESAITNNEVTSRTTDDKIYLSDETKELLQSALAQDQHTGPITPEDALLALTEETGNAGEILRKHNLTYERLVKVINSKENDDI